MSPVSQRFAKAASSAVVAEHCGCKVMWRRLDGALRYTNRTVCERHITGD